MASHWWGCWIKLIKNTLMEEVEGLFKQNAVMIRQSSMELQPFFCIIWVPGPKKNWTFQHNCIALAANTYQSRKSLQFKRWTTNSRRISKWASCLASPSFQKTTLALIPNTPPHKNDLFKESNGNWPKERSIPPGIRAGLWKPHLPHGMPHTIWEERGQERK